LDLQNNTKLYQLQNGWTPTMHTKTRPHLTSSKAGVTSFGERLPYNNLKLTLQPRTNQDVTHQRGFAQTIFRKFGTTIVGCNNFKIKLQRKSNQYVTHQTTSAQITIRKFWNYIKTHLSHLQKGGTPTGHTKTTPHPTSCKQVVSSFSEKLACNNLIFIHEPKTNYVVTHQTHYPQMIIDRLWNYVTTQNCTSN